MNAPIVLVANPGFDAYREQITLKIAATEALCKTLADYLCCELRQQLQQLDHMPTPHFNKPTAEMLVQAQAQVASYETQLETLSSMDISEMARNYIDAAMVPALNRELAHAREHLEMLQRAMDEAPE